MNKNIITEVKRISDLMGIKNIISEATNPIMVLLRTLTQYEADVYRIIGKTLAQVDVSDLKRFWDKLPKGLKDELMKAVDQKLSSIISKDLIEKSTYDQLKKEIISSGVEPYFAGKWVRNFVEKNKVDTVDDHFANILKKEVVSDASKVIFNIKDLVTPKQLKIIDDAAEQIEKGTIRKLNTTDWLKYKKVLEELQVDLEKSLDEFEKNLLNRRQSNYQSKINLYKQVISEIKSILSLGIKNLPSLSRIGRVMLYAVVLGVGVGVLDIFCTGGWNEQHNYVCGILNKVKNTFGEFTGTSSTKEDEKKSDEEKKKEDQNNPCKTGQKRMRTATGEYKCIDT